MGHHAQLLELVGWAELEPRSFLSQLLKGMNFLFIRLKI
jgi:hypothetical protein